MSTMAIFLNFPLQASLLVLCLLCFSENSCAIETGKSQNPHRHIVSVSSLLPSTTCKHSNKVSSYGTYSLELVHKYGPCSELNQGKITSNQIWSKILLEDQARVDSINFRRRSMNSDKNELRQTKSTTFPFGYNLSIGDGNFYAKVKLGTPGQSVYVVLDTGSDITWIQCKPCNKCFKQVGPIFDPSKSSSYSTIPCESSRCNLLTASSPPHEQGCKSAKCTYTSGYLDGSVTRGLFVQDKLTFKSKGGRSKGIVEDYLFGCGLNNSMVGSTGIMGLSRAPSSFVYQTARSLGKYFSYCIPSDFGTNGYLTFGKPDDRHMKHIKFTPIPTTPQQSQFYDVVITGISVDGKKLPIKSSVFTKAGAIVDSGTPITRLPEAAYAALRSAFRKTMAHYKLTKPDPPFDTCYDFSHEDKIKLPKVSFFFEGGVELDVNENGIIVMEHEKQACLAFTSTEDEAILGNVAQRAVQVVFDVEGGRVGFGSGTCN